MNGLPIARPNDEQRVGIEKNAERLLTITAAQQSASKSLLDWLKVEYEIEKPSQKLAAFVNLDSDAWIAEVKKVRGAKKPLSSAALAALREEHARTIVPAQAQAAEALKLEHSINDLVNAAYGLTPAEVALMWKTAPPRMPIAKP